MSQTFDPYHMWLGIPPEEQPPNHYRLLGLPPFESEPEVIQNVANQRMAHLRTFQAGDRAEIAEKLLNELSAARLCLLKADKKAKYDDQLKKLLAPKPEALEELSAPVDLLSEALDFESTAPAGGLMNQSFGEPAEANAKEEPKPKSKRGMVLVIAGSVTSVLLLGFLVYYFFFTPSPDPIVDTTNNGTKPNSNNVNANNNSSNNTGSSNNDPEVTTNNTPKDDNPPPVVTSRVEETPDGNVLRFDKRDYVTLENSHGLGDLRTAFTVEAWCRWQNDQQSMILFGPWGMRPPATNPQGWFVEISGLVEGQDSFLTFYYPNGKDIVTLPGGKFKYEKHNQWHHLAICNGSDHIKFFLDGVMIASEPNEALHRLGVSPNTFSIGSGLGLTTVAPFHGELGGFRLSSVDLYDDGFTPKAKFDSESSTQVLLDFSQPVEKKLVDQSGKDRNGKVVGAAWLSNDGTQSLFNDTETIDDKRVTWKFGDGQGMFRKSGDQWIEQKPDQTTEMYYEMDREDDYIELAGIKSADKHYRLTSSRLVTWNNATSAWSMGKEGGWDIPNVSPLPVARNLVPSKEFALQLQTFDYITLTETKQLLERGDMTLEMWVRLDLNSDKHIIIGDNVLNSDDKPPGVNTPDSLGWLLYCESTKDPEPSANLILDMANKDYRYQLERPADWHHFAFCRKNQQFWFYVDGRSVINGRVAPGSGFDNSTIDLRVGYYKERLGTLRTSLNGELADLRISKDLLYAGDFDPPTSFERDVDTVRLYDFAKARRDEFPDLSGYNAVAINSGSKRVDLDTKPIHDDGSDVPLEIVRPKGIKTIGVRSDFHVSQARQTIKTELQPQIVAASNAEQKQALAATLLTRAKDGTETAEIRFVLFEESQRLFAEAGQWEPAFQTIDEMGWHLEGVDVWTRKATVAKIAANATTTPTGKKKLVEAILQLVDLAILEKRVYVASDLIQLAFTTVARAQSPSLRVTVNERRQKVDQAKAPFDGVMARLQSDPGDVRANLNWGKFECLIRRDWKKGLPYLAKGDEVQLKLAAELDSTNPTLATEQIAIAESWGRCSTAFNDQMKEAILLRARYWYLQANQTADDSQKQTIQSQVQKIDEFLGW